MALYDVTPEEADLLLKILIHGTADYRATAKEKHLAESLHKKNLLTEHTNSETNQKHYVPTMSVLAAYEAVK